MSSEDILRQIVEEVDPVPDEHGVWTGSIVDAVRATAERARAAEDKIDRIQAAVVSREVMRQSGVIPFDAARNYASLVREVKAILGIE